MKNLLIALMLSTVLYGMPDCQKASNTQDFVKRFYSVILGRSADNAGMDEWTNQLLLRKSTAATIAQGFIFSREYNIDSKNNTQYINDLYSAFFNRDADIGGLNGWLSQLNAGTSREDVLHGFLYSQEFINLSNSYGIQAYEGATFESAEITNFVQRFYTVILGRSADTDGLVEWTSRLSAGVSTGADIARGFIFSTEYNIDSKSNTQYLNDLYSAFFNRSADTEGLNGWIAQLNSGTSRIDVLDGFLGSAEFINLTNSYGILAFEGASEATPISNTPPTANAGTNQSVFLGENVILDGSASTDSDGSISCYWWKEENTLLAMTENMYKSDFSEGRHSMTLSVVDNQNVSASTSVEISVSETLEKPIAFGQDVVLNIADTDFKITLNASSTNGILLYTIVTQPQHGTLLGTAPHLRYVPNDGYIGKDSFSYKVSNGEVESEVKNIDISILILNTLNDSYNTDETVGVRIEAELSGDQDWVGIFKVSDNNDWGNVIAWNWVENGITQLTSNPKPMPAGEYEVRLFFHNEYGADATVKARYSFTVTEIENVYHYGDMGEYDVELDNNDSDYIVYKPKNHIQNAPVILFFGYYYAMGNYTDNQKSSLRHEGIMQYLASLGCYVIGNKNKNPSWTDATQWFSYTRALEEAENLGADTNKLGMVGHSAGAMSSYWWMKKYKVDGYGQTKSFIIDLHGYYASKMTQNDLSSLVNVDSLIIAYGGLDGNASQSTHVHSPDFSQNPRVLLTVSHLLPDSVKKGFVVLNTKDHMYSYGEWEEETIDGDTYDAIKDKRDLLEPIDAMVKYEWFNDNGEYNNAQDILFQDYTQTIIDVDDATSNFLLNGGNYEYECSTQEDINYCIDYQ